MYDSAPAPAPTPAGCVPTSSCVYQRRSINQSINQSTNKLTYSLSGSLLSVSWCCVGALLCAGVYRHHRSRLGCGCKRMGYTKSCCSGKESGDELATAQSIDQLFGSFGSQINHTHRFDDSIRSDLVPRFCFRSLSDAVCIVLSPLFLLLACANEINYVSHNPLRRVRRPVSSDVDQSPGQKH